MATRASCAGRAACVVVLGVLFSGKSFGERIDFLGPFVDGVRVDKVHQGETFSLLARLSANNDIPLFGYSLNVDVEHSPGTFGEVTGNAELSNFYEQQNLIVQGGGTLHPLLSIIIEPGDDGLFVNGVNSLPIPVDLAQPGVNDILAELIFETTPATEGNFTFDLGPGSVLSHVPKEELAFEVIPKRVDVIVPEPGMLGLAGACAMLCLRRRSVIKQGRGSWL